MPDTAPSVADYDTWLAARAQLLDREKAHTRESDAIAAARRRLPMTPVPRDVRVTGPDGPVPMAEVFAGFDELIVYKHMFMPGEPAAAQCEGCTISIWGMHDSCYLNAQGVGFAVFAQGPYNELASFRAFMGYGHAWYSNESVTDPTVAGGGAIASYLRRGDDIFLTYEATDRGVEAVIPSLALLDMSPFGRRETWEDSPDGWPQEATGTFWRTDRSGRRVGFGRGRPVPQWTRMGVRPR